MKRLNHIVIIVSGIVFLCALLVVSMFYTPQKVTLESCTERYGLFLELFKRLGYKIQFHYSSLLPEKDSIIILFDYKSKDILDFNKLLEWAKNGGTLFLAGISETKDPVFNNLVYDRLQKGQVISGHSLAKNLKGTEIATRKCFKSGDKNIPEILGTQNCPIFIGEKYDKGYIYILSDSSFMTYMNISKHGVAIFFNEFLKQFYNKMIYIYKSRYELANDIPVLGVLFFGRLKYITIQLMLVGLLFLVAKGVRFGKPLKYQKYIQRSLRTHLIAVGHFYKKVGANRIVENISRSYFIFRLQQILKIGEVVHKRDASLIEQLCKNAKVSKHDIEHLFLSGRIDSISHILNKEKLRSRFIKQLSQ